MLGNVNDKETHVLLVEDDVNLREITSRELRRAGFDVTEVADGERALEHIKREGADVVLLDLRLSGMDGADVLRNIRDNGWDTEVIIITAYSTVQSAINCMKLGAYDYIEKPYEMDRLSPIAADTTMKSTDAKTTVLFRWATTARSTSASETNTSIIPRTLVSGG